MTVNAFFVTENIHQWSLVVFYTLRRFVGRGTWVSDFQLRIDRRYEHTRSRSTDINSVDVCNRPQNHENTEGRNLLKIIVFKKIMTTIKKQCHLVITYDLDFVARSCQGHLLLDVTDRS